MVDPLETETTLDGVASTHVSEHLADLVLGGNDDETWSDETSRAALDFWRESEAVGPELEVG